MAAIDWRIELMVGAAPAGNSQARGREPPEKYGTSFCLTELGFVFW
jgi:hypothetical protein